MSLIKIQKMKSTTGLGEYLALVIWIPQDHEVSAYRNATLSEYEQARKMLISNGFKGENEKS